MTIKELAEELLKGCPPEAREDHEKIARLIRQGASRAKILNMEETDRWPETYFYLKHIQIEDF